MKTQHIKHAAAILLLAAVVCAPGCSTNPVTGKRELSLISREQEIAMGREAAPQFEEEFGGRVANETLQSYVQSVGQKLATESHRPMPYDYALVRSDVPNAFALPGGMIYLTAGLMSRMENERQLAAVLGHETGHVSAKHNVNGLQRQMGAAILVEIAEQVLSGDKGQVAAEAAKIATGMANLRYSRNDEYQADQLGIEYMAKAGYNPHGMVELLEVLMSLSESEPGTFDEMFLTHPLTSKRIAEAKTVVKAEHAEARATAADPRAEHFRKMRDLARSEMQKSSD